MPEPTEDFETLDDFQLAAWYRWSSDESDRFSVAGAFQKTWNNGSPDRSLLVLKANYFPLDGWDFSGVGWIDFYGNDEVVKDGGPEITQPAWRPDAAGTRAAAWRSRSTPRASPSSTATSSIPRT